MARSPVTDLLEQFKSLNEVEQNVFLDMVSPEPEPEAPKQTRKKRAARTPKTTGLPKPGSDTPRADSGALCTAILVSNGRVCNTAEGYQLHHDKGYVDYHPFEPPASVAAKRSSRKSAVTNSTVNSETGKENVSAVGVGAGD